MIRDIFLPESIKGYYLLSKRIIGIDIGKTEINATQIYLKGFQVVIEKSIEASIEINSGQSYEEGIGTTLKKIIDQLDPFDVLYTVLPSSVAIFKELKLPFTTHDKLKMVVNYEIESLLPFSIHDAVVDFIITKQNIPEGNSEILVAAVQNQHIAAHLQLYAHAGISPDKITIDLFALFGLYTQMPNYAAIRGTVALVDIALQTIRIAYIHEGQLRFIRSINKGILQEAKIISENLDLQSNEIIEYLMRYGLDNYQSHRYGQAISQTFTAFLQEIQFTLQSFSAQSGAIRLSKIILLGQGANIKGITEFASTTLNVPCELININEILNNKHVTLKNKTSLSRNSTLSLACAFPCPITEHFNLRQGEFSVSHEKTITKQFIIAGILLSVVVGIVSFHTFWQLRTLKNEARASALQALDLLKNRPNFSGALQEGLKNIKDEKKLAEAVPLAADAVKKQEEMWFVFAGSARASILKYLLDLTNRIDKTALGLDIESLTITQETITLKASVKNHEALKVLEKELNQSKLFSYVSSPQETSFTMKIQLAKNSEDQS